ncbi:MAG: DUF7793 family protein [Bacteroidia bacterium]
MSLHVIESDHYTITIQSKNYLEYLVKPGALIDVRALTEGKKRVMEFDPTAKYFVYAEGVEFFTFTKEARIICATKEHLSNVYANAFYTTNISLLLLSEIFIKINKPAVPTKVFKSREAAKRWLNEQMNQSIREQ